MDNDTLIVPDTLPKHYQLRIVHTNWKERDTTFCGIDLMPVEKEAPKSIYDVDRRNWVRCVDCKQAYDLVVDLYSGAVEKGL
jgi:hypothetical protein